MKTHKRIISLGLIVLMCCALFAGCGGKAEPSPTPTEAPQPADTDDSKAQPGVFVGEVLSFNTLIRAEAEFDGKILSGLRVSEKTVGGDDFAHSAHEAAYQAYFIGKALPLAVEGVSIPDVPAYQAQAVAIAINEAYKQTLSAEYDELLTIVNESDVIQEPWSDPKKAAV